MNIEDFIKARLDEDEQIAEAAAGGSAARWVADEDEVYAVFGSLTDPDRCEDHAPGRPNMCEDNRIATADDCSDRWLDERARHIARHDPVRVLRQAPILRAMVELIRGMASITQQIEAESAVLYPLAAIWDQHPDYLEAWKP
ncbi:hypothetical protein ATM97_27835 [Nocardia sp. MH4]|uniref:DUF6221 family protein n=1 Tax=Nocardia sp. MH4 TaxID=1768677 RepID=UPI001C4EC14B|nr:DUF6221 family protein [Nocardia sp. MH4]MBW0275016.1 hypothetical protein [Nocardia sp. MH4]